MSNENPYDFGPGQAATSSQSNANFTVGKIDAMQCLQEGWALIQDKYMLFLGISFVGALIGGAVPVVLIGAMMCGIFFTLFKRMRGEEVAFDDLFKGFDYFKDSLIATLIVGGLGLVVFFGLLICGVVLTIVGAVAGEQVGPVIIVVGSIVLFVMYILCIFALNIIMMFVFPLIVDRGLSPMQAVKTSWAAGRANAGGIIVYMLLSFVVGFVGLLVCIIGVYFVLPVLYAGQAVVYRRVFPALDGKAAV
ncbi:MAG: putative membrane protein [Pirellulaceae bacterium]|jgi:uncharacterized membrane protein